MALGDDDVIVIVPCTFSNTNFIVGETRERYRHFYSDDVIDSVTDRLDWDEAGLLAILENVGAEFRVDDRIFLTGFSGGGLLTYRMLFRHPNRLAAAMPVCANFRDEGYGSISMQFSNEDRALPVHVFNGGLDGFAQNMQGYTWFDQVFFGSVFGFVIGFLAAKRKLKRRWQVLIGGGVAIAVGGFFRYGNPGIESQSRAAMKLLDKSGYVNVQRTVVANMPHAPGHEVVVEAIRSLRLTHKPAADAFQPNKQDICVGD